MANKGEEGAFQGKPVSMWKEQLNDDSELVRATATIGLGECGLAAVPALIEALKHKDGVVRFWAARGLGKIDPEAKPAAASLVAVLQDASESVRVCAAEALWRIGQRKDGLAGLIEGTKAQSAGARLLAVNALSRIGPGAKEALEAVKAAAAIQSNDPVQGYVARKAEAVVKALEGGE